MRVSHETIYKSLLSRLAAYCEKSSSRTGPLGGKNSHIATLVKRQSRYAVLVQVPGKDTESVVNALVRQVKSLPAGLMSTRRGIAALNSRTTSGSRSRPM